MRIKRIIRVSDRPMARATYEDAPEGFMDASVVLGAGVYVLLLDGEVVYIGYAKKMLDILTGHNAFAKRTPQPWHPIPGVVYDQVMVLPCGPDRGNTIATNLIAKYQPKGNDSRVVSIRRKLA